MNRPAAPSPAATSTSYETPSSPSTSPTVAPPIPSPSISPTTASPSPVPTTPAPGGKSCSAAYKVASSWPGGFQAEVTIAAGSSAISGWTVTWTYANGQQISQSWNSKLTTSGASVTATNVEWNGALTAGATTSFGFIGTYGSANSTPTAVCTAR